MIVKFMIALTKLV